MILLSSYTAGDARVVREKDAVVGDTLASLRGAVVFQRRDGDLLKRAI